MLATGCNNHIEVHSRREFLEKSGFGLGAMALAHLLDKDKIFAQENRIASLNPLTAKVSHFPAKAKSIIYLFMQGGPSQVDTFDPKPMLAKYDGHPLPPSMHLEKGINLQNIQANRAKLMQSPFSFSRYGKSGLAISELFHKLGSHADDLAVIRSCYHDLFIHGPALNMMYSGSNLNGHPSIGSWVLYGLGSETDNLPAFMAMTEGIVGTRSRKSFRSGFLPAIYQGTLLRGEGSPIMNLSPPVQIDENDQRVLLNQVNQWNQRHMDTRQDDSRLAARLSNYELAFRMQTAAPELMDISREPKHVRCSYGIGENPTDEFGRMCLLGRRMVERGVRFIQLISTDWDGHAECETNHRTNGAKVDKPIAALLSDLKQRGLLESTLVVSVGEFGRTPMVQGIRGRDHHPYGFSAWMAGGGIQGGKVIGSTDDIGFHSVEDKVHAHDLHATMLTLLGLDHEKLTYFYQGRDRRLTDIGGNNNLAERLTRA